jgi:hypothetical protein
MKAGRAVRVGSLAGVILIAAGCASDPIVGYPDPSARRYGSGYGNIYRQQQDPLRRGAQDANSVESIVSSAARIGRLLSGSYY